jgi:hypothetical protein
VAATEHISQIELARRLNRTERQIRNLDGIPRNDDGTYPWPASQEWWIRFKQKEKLKRSGVADSSGVSDLDRARAAKEWAIARLRELELEQLEGTLVGVEYMASQMERSFMIVRSKLQNLPGTLAPRLAGLKDVAKIQVVLQESIDELMKALSTAGEAPELDADDDDSGGSGRADGSDSEGGVAA